MILELWLAFLCLSAVLTALGMWIEETPLVFVGLFFFFLLGCLVLFNQLEYETGMTVTKVNSTVSTIEYDNASFTGDYAQWFGFFLAVVAGAGMWLVFVDWKRAEAG